MSLLKKINVSTLLNYVLFVIVISFGTYVANGKFLFGSNPEERLDLVKLLISATIFLVFSITIIVFNLVNKKYKFHWPLLFVFLAMIIAPIIAIIIFKNEGTYNFISVEGDSCSFVFQITNTDKVCFIIETLVFFILNFIVIDLTYQIFEIKTFLKIVSFAILIAVTTFVVISLVTEFDKYLSFFVTLFDKDNSTSTVSSIFINSNVFAFMLTFGLFAISYLHHFYKKKFILIFFIIPYAVLIFTLCRSLLILDFLFIIIYIAIALNNKFLHQRKKRIMINLCFSFSLIAVLGIIRLILISTNTMDQALAFIFKENRFRTIETRSWLWSKTCLALNNSNWFVGIGHNLFEQFLYQYNYYDSLSFLCNNTGSAHNAILQWIGEGGIVMLIGCILIFAMIVFLIFKNFKKSPELMSLVILVICFIVIRSMIESGTFIMPTTLEYLSVTLLTVVPILYISKNSKH